MSDDRPDIEAAKRLARQLGVGAGAPAGSGAGEEEGEADQGEGRLRLDKDGTLVGRPKLTPVKALRGDHAPGDHAPGDDAPGDHAPGDDAPGDHAPGDDAPGGDTKGSDSRGSDSSDDGSAAAPPENAPRRASLPPKRATLRPDGFIPPPPDATPPGEGDDDALLDTGDEIEIPSGEFLFGEDAASRFISSFHIDRYPVTNRDYANFVHETHHRPPLYWPDGIMPPSLGDHPVVGVDYFDALAYAQWLGKDLPFEDEWERAARGVDGRTYPWGDETEFSAANNARVDLKMTTPVTLYKQNESPEGCRDMVGNTWELTHSPAAGGGVVVRGGSWYDFALYAKTYFRFATAPSARNGTIGFRCVRRHTPRPDEAREVDGAIIEAEIASRRGSQTPVDPSEFSPERRDLVIDALRLNTYVHEVQADSLVATIQPRPRGGAGDPLDPRSLLLQRDVPAGDAFPGDVPPAPEPSLASLEPLISEDDAPPSHAVEPDLGAGNPEAGHGDDDDDTGPKIGFGPRPGVEPAVQGRLHVDGGTGKVAPFASGQAASGQDSGEAVGEPPTTPATAPKPKSMPRAMWVLLAAGFALFGALLASLLTGDETNESGTPPMQTGAADQPVQEQPLVSDLDPDADPDADPDPDPAQDPDGGLDVSDPVWERIAALPERGQGPLDGRAPQLVDAADAAQRASLNKGTWALFFLDPASDVGSSSLRAIHSLHRRTATQGLTVAIVVDRSLFEIDGSLPDTSAIEDALAAFQHVSDGLVVVLDPRGADDEGVLKTEFARAGKALYGTLVHNGTTESRTRPPRSAPGFEMPHLVRLVQRALELAPNLQR